MPNFLERVNPNEVKLSKKFMRSIVAAMPTSNEYPYADIGERLLWHRSEVMEVDQAAYVKRTRSVKRSAYSNWETGSTRLSLNGAIELVDAYGLSLDFLYFGNADTLPLALRNAWMSRFAVKA